MSANKRAAEIIKRFRQPSGYIPFGDIPLLQATIAAALTEAGRRSTLTTEARRQLAEAAYELPIMGRLPDRIRALKNQHREALAAAAKPIAAVKAFVEAANFMRHQVATLTGELEETNPADLFRFHEAMSAYDKALASLLAEAPDLKDKNPRRAKGTQ